ncbi:MAG TPA: ester cyclase [Solirubrobacterales bacterium]|nr:ester cyclase [Solirubrobacterales bacterium]
MPTESETAADVERIARDYFARVSARDPDGMMVFWVPGRGANIHGLTELVAPDSYRAWFANLFAAIPDMRFEVEEVVADETRAAVRWRARGTFSGTGKLEGFEPNGAEIEMVGMDLLTIENGKLVDNQAYTNGMALARQIGALPPQGSRAEKAMAGAFNLRTRVAKALKR